MDQGSRKITLLVSGGPDSATLAKVADDEESVANEDIDAIYLKTGHASDAREIEASNHVVASLGGNLEIVDISDMVSSLGGQRVLIHSQAAILPFGNAIVLSYAISYAWQTGSEEIWIGLHGDDADENHQYTRSYIDKIEALAAETKQPYPRIVTPFIEIPKSGVFQRGSELEVEYEHTWSCIRAGQQHCGNCGACRARRRAFNLVGLNDPTNYANEPTALETANSH